MSAIEQYLADLDDELRVRRWRRERILAEVRDHLEEGARETREEEQTSQAEAEQRAVAALGSPGQVARGFAAEAENALNRTAVAVSDFSYRVARNRQAVTPAVGMSMGLVVLGILGEDPDSFMYMSLCSFWGMAVAVGFRALVPAPRPGYVRRWRKLDLGARRQIAGALRGGKAPSQPPASDVAVEVKQRVRNVRRYLWLGVLFGVSPLALLIVYAAVADGEPLRWATVLVLGLWVACPAMIWRDWRSARRQVESELAALEVVEEVAGEVLRTGRARLQERYGRPTLGVTRFWFDLVPEDPKACAVSLEVSRRALDMWLVPRPRFRPDTRLDRGGLHVESHGGSDGGRWGGSLRRTE